MTRNRRCSPQTLALLSALLDEPRPWFHGYDLAGNTGLKSGTIYPILMRLSRQGLLEAKWGEPVETGRPPRHLYRLTSAGTAYARAQTALSSQATGKG